MCLCALFPDILLQKVTTLLSFVFVDSVLKIKVNHGGETVLQWLFIFRAEWCIQTILNGLAKKHDSLYCLHLHPHNEDKDTKVCSYKLCQNILRSSFENHSSEC